MLLELFLFPLLTIPPGPSLGTAPARSKINSTTLSDLANASDAIVVGRVISVVCISADGVAPAKVSPGEAARCATGRAVAEIAVERVIRGDPDAQRVWYLGESMRRCDVTLATLGQRGLFFLNQSEPIFAPGPAYEEAYVYTSGQPVLRDAHAGRGRMPLRAVNDEDWLTSWDDVEPPAELLTRPADWMGEYESLYWCARLDPTLRYIEAELRTRMNPLPAHPVSGVPARIAVFGDGGQVVAALWADEAVVWSEDPRRGGPPFRVGEAAPYSLLVTTNWCRARDLEHEPSSTGAASARVTVRVGGMLHDLALRHTGSAAAQLRDLVIESLPEEGDPLITGSLPVR